MFLTRPLELKHLMIQQEGKGATKRLYVLYTYCTGRRALKELLILWTSFIVSGMPLLLLMLYNFSWTLFPITLFPGLPRNPCVSYSKSMQQQQSGIHRPRAVSAALHKFIDRIFQGYYMIHRSVVLLANQETDKCKGGL